MPSDQDSTTDGPKRGPVTYGHPAVRAGDAGMVPGAIVGDQEGDGDSRAVVLDVFNDTADNVYVEIESGDGRQLRTVADLNKSYPRDAQVVKVAFLEDVEAALPEWQSIDRALLINHVSDSPVRTYDYPKPRLYLLKQ